MAKLTGVYKDKKTGKWYYSISLGFDAVTGKRIRKMRRGFHSQKDAYEAKTAELKDTQDMGRVSNSSMNYNNFLEQLFIPEYKSKVQITTFENRMPVLKKISEHFGKKKLDDISNLSIP